MNIIPSETNYDQLIPVFDGYIGGRPCQLVDARTLHSWLGLKSQFTNWITKRIREYRFEEDVDFLLNQKIKQNFQGGHNRIDYHISLDMAKELSMVERTDRGREARKYFIDCERKAHELATRIQAMNYGVPFDTARIQSSILEHNARLDRLEQLALAKAVKTPKLTEAKAPKPKKQVEYIGMRELQDKILQVIGGRTYFSFTEITDRVGQGHGKARAATEALKKLGYETVSRRRINGDRHSIWAKANSVIDIDEAKDTLNFICAML